MQIKIIEDWVRLGLITREQSSIAYRRLNGVEKNPYTEESERLSWQYGIQENK